LRPLRTCNSPKVGRKVCKSQEGAQLSSDRLKKKIWTIGFYVQEDLRRSLQKEETDNYRISLENPVSRWIRRKCLEFILWSKHMRIKDLNHQI